MNFYLVFIVGILVAHYLLDLLADVLNVRNCSEQLPEEFRDVYDAGKYARSQQYLKDHTRMDTVVNSAHTLIILAFILLGGFRLVELAARKAGWDMIGTGLLFGGILMILSQLLHLPSSIYSTFVLEAKYDFNKTTPKTFVLDIVKSLALTVIIGAPVFALILWFFDAAGEWAWLWCWLAVMLIQALLMFIAPVVIMPLFNKFEPLEDGELKTAIENYARGQNFKMKGVFKMDGSKR
ncbi:MAG TPA: M48 family metallopeptidase, partial [Kiritimatiellia bacterium]|nr:M48 family metallopeptidase [Kiritimatiellia bacterium]